MAAPNTRVGSRSTSKPLLCSLEGPELLQDPHFNKGSAFTLQERHDFSLVGLLPSNVNSLDEQAKRAYQQCQSHRTPLGKNTFMTDLKEQNEVLYYRVIQDHIKEMFPVIYTPTEGDAIANYSRLFRRSEGCFLNINEPDHIQSALQHWSSEDIDVIVCSDGEQILGIGDQGVGAILISVAKLVIYTLCAGIHPDRTLPVVLDVGTDNEELLQDELYLGVKQKRIRGKVYQDFIDRFLNACRTRFPQAHIHFEDFGLQNARRILDRYSPQFACFNDDVQGTGCVTLAAIYSALHVMQETKMQDLRVVVFGAGTAGIGIADQIRDAIAVESGKSKEEASNQIWCVDKPGIVLHDQEGLSEVQRSYSKSDKDWPSDKRSLLDVIRTVKPHVLIGTSTKPKSFTQEIVQEMAKHSERPIILPLSNPTKLHEATPEDLVKWTDGKVLTATGSPFDPVEYNGRKRVIAECNNSTIFPGIGLGVILSRAKLLTSEMLVAATKALAAQAPVMKDDDPDAGLLPDVVDVREISVQIAAAVIKQARTDGLAQETIPDSTKDLEQWIRDQMWDASYRELKKN